MAYDNRDIKKAVNDITFVINQKSDELEAKLGFIDVNTEHLNDTLNEILKVLKEINSKIK